MRVTYISLSEYFDKCLPRAKKAGYIWIISFIARYSDAQGLYEQLDKNWASLNDLTGKKILFIFSTPSVRDRSSFLHIPGREVYEGKMCPFVELLDGEDVENGAGSFKCLYGNVEQINWKQKHSQSITEFAENYGISEKEIPCLFLYDLVRERQQVIPLKEDADIYTLIKSIVIKMAPIGFKKKQIEHELEEFQRVEQYYNLYNQLNQKADMGGTSENEAIKTILCSPCMYKQLKKDILDVKIKRNLKRIGQWKRQYFDDFEKNQKNKERYEKLKWKQEMVEKELDMIWDGLSNVSEVEVAPVIGSVLIDDLISACVKMQSNVLYMEASENQRNDYIRDILKAAGYDVLDQTRRGSSLEGKDAGEVDILIEEKSLPIAIIEALNMTYFNTKYLDNHIEKIYKYDTVGNQVNIILAYVYVSDFYGFCEKYAEHIQRYKYKYPLISFNANCKIQGRTYSNIKVMEAIHSRNGCETVLYHICILFEKRK